MRDVICSFTVFGGQLLTLAFNKPPLSSLSRRKQYSYPRGFCFCELQERLTGYSLWSNMREGASDLGVPFRAFGEKRKHWPLSISLYTAASLAVSAVLWNFPVMFADPQKSPTGEPPLRAPFPLELGSETKVHKSCRQTPKSYRATKPGGRYRRLLCPFL